MAPQPNYSEKSDLNNLTPLIHLGLTIFGILAASRACGPATVKEFP